MSPLLGEARLTSAIIAGLRARNASTNERDAGARAASAAISLRGAAFIRASSSSRLAANILSRIEAMLIYRRTCLSAPNLRSLVAHEAYPLDRLERPPRRKSRKRQLDSFRHRSGAAANINRGASVEREHILRRARVTGKRAPQHLGRFSGFPREQFGGIPRRDSELLRRDCEFPDLAAANLDHAGGHCERNLIEAVFPVHDHRMLDAERRKRLGHRTQQPRFRDANQLPLRPCRIRQRRNQVEQGADAERAPQDREPREHRMIRRGKDKAESRAFETSLEPRGIEIDLYPEALHYVGRTDPPAYRAIAMLGHRHTGRRRNQRRSGRNIERAGAISARPRGVGHVTVVEIERARPLAHRTRAARELGGRFALELERDQESRDQDVGYDVVENLGDNGFGFGGVERAAREHFVECLAQVDHAPTLARKLRSRVLPPGVPIDSGWNCTPSIG